MVQMHSSLPLQAQARFQFYLYHILDTFALAAYTDFVNMLIQVAFPLIHKGV